MGTEEGGMIMYIETDSNGKIIIQDISQEEAVILDDCLCTYYDEAYRSKIKCR